MPCHMMSVRRCGGGYICIGAARSVRSETHHKCVCACEINEEYRSHLQHESLVTVMCKDARLRAHQSREEHLPTF